MFNFVLLYVNLICMRYLKIKSLWIILVSTSFFFSCTEDSDLVKNSGDTAWSKAIGFDEAIINSAYLNEKLYLMGSNSFFADAKLTTPNTPFYYDKFISRPGWQKLPISDKILITKSELNIFFFSVSNLNDQNKVEINTKEIDPDFMKFEEIPSYQGESMGVTENGTVLVPYRAAISGIAENNPRFIIIKTSSSSGKIEITETKVLKPNILFTYDQVLAITSFSNFFVANIGGSIVKINENGEITDLGNFNSYKTVKINSEILSFGLNNSKNELTFFKSDLNGNNRREISKFPLEDPMNTVQLSSIDNKIIGFSGDKIYVIEVEPNRLKISELVNTKLEGGFISSITMADSNTVLVTAACHIICGGFSKPLETFFETKN